jgi:hypothetical protein
MTCVPRLQDSAKKAKLKATGDSAKKRTRDSAEKHRDKIKDSQPIKTGIVVGLKFEGEEPTRECFFVFTYETSQLRVEYRDICFEELAPIMDFYDNRCPDDDKYEAAVVIKAICERHDVPCSIDMEKAAAKRKKSGVTRSGRPRGKTWFVTPFW